MSNVPAITREEARGAKEVIPGKEYEIRPGVHLVLERAPRDVSACRLCMSAEKVEYARCLGSLAKTFEGCTVGVGYYWALKLIPELIAPPTPIQPSLF